MDHDGIGMVSGADAAAESSTTAPPRLLLLLGGADLIATPLHARLGRERKGRLVAEPFAVDEPGRSLPGRRVDMTPPNDQPMARILIGPCPQPRSLRRTRVLWGVAVLFSIVALCVWSFADRMPR